MELVTSKSAGVRLSIYSFLFSRRRRRKAWPPIATYPSRKLCRNSSSRRRWWKRRTPTSGSWKTTSITCSYVWWRRRRAFYGRPMSQKRRRVNSAKNRETGGKVANKGLVVAHVSVSYGKISGNKWGWSKPNSWLSCLYFRAFYYLMDVVFIDFFSVFLIILVHAFLWNHFIFRYLNSYMKSISWFESNQRLGLAVLNALVNPHTAAIVCPEALTVQTQPKSMFTRCCLLGTKWFDKRRSCRFSVFTLKHKS